MTRKKDYEVGYGRPPKEHRFQPGRSGNPKGRAKGSTSLASVIRQAAQEFVTITENGKRKRITKLDAALKQNANRAAAGDPKAFQQLLALLERVDRAEPPPPPPPTPRRTDAEILKAVIQKFNSDTGENDG